MKNQMLNEMRVKWQPQDSETAVKTVMGACIKDLTGLFIYTTYCLGRANQLKEGMKDGSATTLRVADPLMEEIMDAKKKLQDLTPLYELGDGLTKFVQGGKLDPSIFFPFLNDEEKKDITKEICEKARTLDTIRATSTGTLVASGRNLTSGVRTILGQMSNDRIDPIDVMKILIDDASGRKFYVIAPSENTNQEVEKPTWRIDWDMKGTKGLFESITCNGQQVFQVKEIINKEGMPSKVVVFLSAIWLKEPVRWTLRILLPELNKITKEGHFDVAMPVPGSDAEPKHRFFRPSFVWRSGNMKLEGITEFVKMALLDGLVGVSQRKMNKTSATKRVQEAINQAVRHAVNSLPVVEREIVSPEDTIWSNEFDLRIMGSNRRPDLTNPDLKLSIVDEWKIREKMLTDLAAQGFCINATSKGKPGKVVSKVGDVGQDGNILNTTLSSVGVPDYVLRISPFAKFMEMKRLPEMRELANALQLAEAPDMTLTTKGFPMSAALVGKVRELNVAVFDCNMNVFEDEIGDEGTFCHDTLLGCPSLVEKLKVKNLRFACPDEDKVEMVKARLIDQGFTEDQMEMVESMTDLGSGLVGKSFEIQINMEVEDIGKIKSLGAIKGVPSMLPFQLFSVDTEGNRKEIDVIIPRATFTKKNCLDAGLYMAHAKNGVQEIDPNGEINLDNLPELEESIFDEDGDLLGRGVVGVLPFYRPVQTGLGLFAVRGTNRGIDVPLHVMPLLGINHRVSKGFNESFAQKVSVYQNTILKLEEVKANMKKR